MSTEEYINAAYAHELRFGVILALRDVRARQRWIVTPHVLSYADERPCNPEPLVIYDSAGEPLGLGERGERILKTWNRKGLHIRWGMHHQRFPEFFADPELSVWVDFSRPYALPGWMDGNQNDAHRE